MQDVFEYDYLNKKSLSDNFLLLIQKKKESILNNLLEEYENSYKNNNKKEILSFIQNYIFLNKYHNIPIKIIEKIIEITNKIIIENYMDINYTNTLLKFLSKILKTYKKFINIKLNWKIYYKIFDMFLSLSQNVCITLIAIKKNNYFNTIYSFALTAKKLFIYSEEDYIYLKKIIYRYLFSMNNKDIITAIDIILLFLPRKFYAEDKEFQENIFNLLNNRKDFSNSLLSIFKDILKEKKDLFIDKKQFILKYFELLMNFFSNSNEKKIIKNNKNKNKKIYTISYSMCWIFVFINTHQNFYEFKDIINNNSKIFIDFLNLNLIKENVNDENNIYVTILFQILYSIKTILFEKQINYITKLKIEKFYVLNENNRMTLEKLINKFLNLILKCLFYYDEEEDSFLIMEQLSTIYEFNLNEKIFYFYELLFNEIENNFSEFITKLTAFSKIFLNINNIKNKKYSNFLNKIILLCPNFITSANEEQNINILYFINYIMCLFLENNYNESYYDSIKLSIYKVSIEILNRILQIFDFISSNNIQFFFFDFLYLSYKLNPEKNKIYIKKKLFNFHIDNNLSKENLSVYFLFICYICENFYEIYKNTIADLVNYNYINENIVINNHFIIKYDFSKINFSIEEFNKKKLSYYKEFFSCLDFNFDLNEQDKKQLFDFCALYLNQKEKIYQKISIIIIYNLIDNLLSKKIMNEKIDNEFIKIDLPSKENINITIEIYNIFILPYLQYMQQICLIYNEKDNNNDINILLTKLNKTNDTLIDIIILFLKLSKIFIEAIDNPYLLSEYNIEYKEIYKIKEDILNTTFDLYNNFLYKTKLIKNQNILKKYIQLLLSETIDPSKNSLSQYNSSLKKIDLYYEYINKKNIGLYQLLNHQFFYVGMLRYFKIKNNYLVNKELFIKKIKILKNIFIYSLDHQFKENLYESLEGINYILNKDELYALYKEIYQYYLEKIKKKYLKNKSFKNDNMVLNMIYFYSIFSEINISCNLEKYPEIMFDFIELISYLKEDNILLALAIMEKKLFKKKNFLPVSTRLIENRINSLISFEIKFEGKKIENNIKYKIFENLEKYFFDKFKDKNFFNEKTNQNLTLFIFDLIIYLCDLSEKIDYEFFNKFENIIFDTFITNENLNQKKICLSILSIILQCKFENNYIFSITEYKNLSQEEINNYIKNIYKNKLIITKDYIYIINRNIQKLDFDTNNNYIKDFLQNNFESFLKSLLYTKDLISNQQLIKISKEESPSSTLTSINKYWEYKFLFHIFSIYKINISLDEMYKLFEKIKDDFDDLISISIICQVFSALIKKNIIFDNDNENIIKDIKLYLKNFLEFYTNNKNQFIDNSVIKFFIFIISSCSINKFLSLFKDEQNLFIYFKYEDELAIEMFDIIGTIFNVTKINFIFENNKKIILNENDNINITTQFNVIKNFLNNKKKLINKEDRISSLIQMLLFSCMNITYDNLKCDLNYESEIISLVNYFMKNFEVNYQLKKIIINIVFYCQKIFILYPNDLINILMFVSENFDDDYLNDFTIIDIGNNFNINIDINLIKEYLKIINDNFDKNQYNFYQFQFLLDFIINLLKFNLNKIIVDDSDNEILFLIFSLINNCKSEELREFIMNNLLVFYVNSLSSENSLKLIKDIQEFLLNNNNNHKLNNYFKTSKYSLYVLGAYFKGFYLEIPNYIENIILFFKKIYREKYKRIGIESKIIKNIIKDFLEKYTNYYLNLIKNSLSEEGQDALRDLTNTNIYFS